MNNMPNSDYVDGQHDMLDNAMYHRIMDGIFDFDESIMDSFNASVAASPAVGQNSMFGQEPTQYASNMTMPNSLDFGIEPPVAFPNVTGFEQPQLPVNQQQFGIGQQPLPVGQQQLPEFVAPSMMAPQAVQPNLGRVPIPRAGDTRLDAVLTEKSGPMSRAVAMPTRRKPGRKPLPDIPASTPAEKRKLQNRHAQRKFRDSRKMKLGECTEQMEKDRAAYMEQQREFLRLTGEQQKAVAARDAAIQNQSGALQRLQARLEETERELAQLQNLKL